MAKIFISYRRDDSKGVAGRIYDRLVENLKQHEIFMDVNDINPGDDFVVAICEAVRSCDVFILLIGERWLRVENSAGKLRLNNPSDYVRLEIETALNNNIRIIPVLLDGVNMPSLDDLPDDISQLARLNALPLDHTNFGAGFLKLQHIIQKGFQHSNKNKILLNFEAFSKGKRKLIIVTFSLIVLIFLFIGNLKIKDNSISIVDWPAQILAIIYPTTTEKNVTTTPTPTKTPSVSAHTATIPALSVTPAYQDDIVLTPIIYTPLDDCSPSRIHVGDSVFVSGNATILYIRNEPDSHPTNNVIGVVRTGNNMVVVDGPQCSWGWIMWEVIVEGSGLQGWVVESDGKEFWLDIVDNLNP